MLCSFSFSSWEDSNTTRDLNAAEFLPDCILWYNKASDTASFQMNRLYIEQSIVTERRSGRLGLRTAHLRKEWMDGWMMDG
eukprot:scaffold228994_cov19-Prasinocladus_malaysianus.AAC.1